MIVIEYIEERVSHKWSVFVPTGTPYGGASVTYNTKETIFPTLIAALTAYPCAVLGQSAKDKILGWEHQEVFQPLLEDEKTSHVLQGSV